jgi:hypothetical protein
MTFVREFGVALPVAPPMMRDGLLYRSSTIRGATSGRLDGKQPFRLRRLRRLRPLKPKGRVSLTHRHRSILRHPSRMERPGKAERSPSAQIPRAHRSASTICWTSRDPLLPRTYLTQWRRTGPARAGPHRAPSPSVLSSWYTQTVRGGILPAAVLVGSTTVEPAAGQGRIV